MKRNLLAIALATTCSLALAKLPPQDDAAKAKAAETAARSAWQAKVDGFLLCRAQDRVAARFGNAAGKPAAAAKDAKGAMVATAAVPSTAAKPAAAASATATPAAATAPAANPASPGGTPVSMVAAVPTLPPCLDPGPFAYNPPEQKPLETSGAHSPSGTAASPPSVRQDSAEMAPKK